MLIGRERECADLHAAMDSDKSEFVAVYGRRRVGKTYLIRETFSYSFAFEHTGVKGADQKRQLYEFGESLRRFGRLKRRPRDWYDAFRILGDVLDERPSNGKKVVFLDECPWMDTPRSGFLGALDHFWNGWATMRKDIVLVICGSAASWVSSKIDSNVGGLHNRLTRHIYLRPFTLHECDLFAKAKGLVMNRAQTLECYMILGGVPYYWDLLRKDVGFAQNIDRMLFERGGDPGDLPVEHFPVVLGKICFRFRQAPRFPYHVIITRQSSKRSKLHRSISVTLYFRLIHYVLPPLCYVLFR